MVMFTTLVTPPLLKAAFSKSSGRQAPSKWVEEGSRVRRTVTCSRARRRSRRCRRGNSGRRRKRNRSGRAERGPGREGDSGAARGARAYANRQLLLAQPARGPGRHRVPRGGERVHRGPDGAHRGVAAEALRRDQGADRADRSLGAGQGRRLLLLQPGRGRAGLSHPCAEARVAGRRGRGDPRRQRAGRGARLLQRVSQRQLRRQRDGLCRGHAGAAHLHHPHQGPRDRTDIPRGDRGGVGQHGVGGGQPHAVLCPAGSHHAPGGSDLPSRNRFRSRTGRAGVSRGGRRVQRLRAQDEIEALHRHLVLAHDHRRASLRRRRRAGRRVPGCFCRAPADTSTASTISGTTSTSGRTGTGQRTSS